MADEPREVTRLRSERQRSLWRRARREDVRTWQTNLDTARALMRRGLMDVESTTQRLVALDPKEAAHG